jgi:hypothetical protein
MIVSSRPNIVVACNLFARTFLSAGNESNLLTIFDSLLILPQLDVEPVGVGGRCREIDRCVGGPTVHD